MKKRRFWLIALIVATTVTTLSVPAIALSVRGPFIDDDTNTHEANIDSIEAAGITRGCNPPANTRFCPNNSVTRGQMAAFLNRAASLPAPSRDYFSDDNGSTFENDINRIAEAGITRGCNPPANTRFCPDQTVTRGQMAAFLARALDLPNTTHDFFSDDSTSIFEFDINRMAAARITLGCNPPTNDRFCPNRVVIRGEMATFLARAYDLPGVIRTLPLQHADYNCSKNGLTCSASVAISPNRTYRITEGWYQALPYLGNEQSVFTGSNTRFELRVDGQLVSVSDLGVTTSGSLATRRWRSELTLGPGQQVQGRWIWNGVIVRTTTARLVSG